MRVAVCISGELRTYQPDYLESLRLWFGPNAEIDFYGHTWNHCGTPKNAHTFKECKIQDQNVIDKWIEEDIFRFPKIQSNEYNTKANFFKDTFDTNYVKNFARAVYGQTWSAMESFKLVEESYDVYIRWRWDNLCSNPSSARKVWTYHRDRFNQKCGVQSSHNAFVENGNLVWPDHFWLMNKEAFTQWRSVSDKYPAILDTITSRYTPSSHDLWAYLATKLKNTNHYFIFPEHDILIQWKDNIKHEFSQINNI